MQRPGLPILLLLLALQACCVAAEPVARFDKEPAAALSADDECAAGEGGAENPSCALNAMQLRLRKEAAVVPAAKQSPSSECMAYPKCIKANVTGSCCPTEAGNMLDCCEAQCSLYKACGLVGLSGFCCPTPGGAMLDCCTPQKAEEPSKPGNSNGTAEAPAEQTPVGAPTAQEPSKPAAEEPAAATATLPLQPLAPAVPAAPSAEDAPALVQAPMYDITCFSYTGGTCLTDKCNATRKAECISGKCVCGGCAGADGKCYAAKNKAVAKGFYLHNAKYEDYKMYVQRVSTFGQMSTTKVWSSINMEQDKFDLYEVPGASADGHKAYFLGSAKWANYVMGFKATTGTALSPFAAYSVDLQSKGSLLDVWGPSNIMLRVCQMGPKSSYKGSIRIAGDISTTGGHVWAYVHHGSWLVYGSITDPGDSGIWTPNPPLPQGVLPVCDL